VSIDDGEYRFELVSSLSTTSLDVILIKTREEMRDREKREEWQKDANKQQTTKRQ
jgi:hypothetical protein